MSAKKRPPKQPRPKDSLAQRKKLKIRRQRTKGEK